ncbi:UDP-glucose 4-epimerase GalE [Candidatus Gracilibacteria bacterium]|nr:UDP-glucose 4-epimerase GalE [Candidatus Gracilibacteria bacterium]
MSKTLLITGGLGYIGSHAVVTFTNTGYKCVIIDNLSNTNLNVLENIKKTLNGIEVDFYKIDLLDKKGLKEVFLKYNFDGVLHFAGLKAVGESCEKPFLYYENNVIGSLNLFEIMNEFEVKNIIFSSSATVYKPKDLTDFGLNEKDEVGECSNPYGSTKFLIENILRDLVKARQFKVVNLRYFNPIGAHKDGYLGENPVGIPNNLLPYIFKVVTGELKEVGVFGSDYDTVDGTGVRDYIDVCDLIDGHLKSYKYLENINSPIFEVFNLGVGNGVSVMQMILEVSKIVKKEVPYKILDRRPGDLATVYCDPTKAKNILSWEAKTPLEESLKNSYNFYNK